MPPHSAELPFHHHHFSSEDQKIYSESSGALFAKYCKFPTEPTTTRVLCTNALSASSNAIFELERKQSDDTEKRIRRMNHSREIISQSSLGMLNGLTVRPQSTFDLRAECRLDGDVLLAWLSNRKGTGEGTFKDCNIHKVAEAAHRERRSLFSYCIFARALNNIGGGRERELCRKLHRQEGTKKKLHFCATFIETSF